MLAEDTRVALRLLGSFGATATVESYNDVNGAKVRPRILARLAAGAAVALTSDAGTPLISDPGYRLVDEARSAGIPVHAVPGPSAAIAALSVAGLPSDRFLFAGFLATRSTQRRRELGELARIPATLIFYESANRLPAMLADARDVLGRRTVAVARELTKFYEEVRRGPLDEIAAHYADAGPPRGEIVVLVGPPVAEAETDWADVDRRLSELLDRERTREAVDAVAAETGLPRRDVYRRALALKGDDGDA